MGFLRDARGRLTTIRFPGARSTTAQKLNDRGQVTGYYSTTTDDPREDPTAFLRDRGRYTRIAVPGAVTTTAVGINNHTQVVGQYQTPTASSTAMCGSGAGSPRSTFPAPPRPR